MALVSTNAVAFESYGLNDISGAPICLDCGERFSKAANELIAGEDTHITIGPLVYIFWTREELDFGFGRMLSRPTAEDVRALFAAAWKADRAAAEEAEANRFYAAALSASGARVVVRDWLDTTVARARRNLVRYFALQELVKADGGESEPIGLYALAASTVRDVNKDLSARVPQAVLRVALTGGALPDWLLYQAVNRNRAERKVTRPRAALIKLTLLSQEGEGPTEERRMARVDLTNRTPAYLCGRLLAVMEAVQKAANRGIKATLTDRYFGTASSAPASVMGVLYRNHCRPHLSKLRKERPGVYNALDRRLQEVMQHLDTFPNTLTLKEQALFSLGYYHQRARDRAEATERKRLKEGKTGTAASKEK
jgi:CRISPR-associated protein Csd1